MSIVRYCLAGLGVVLLAVGYFRKSRNLMLLGTIVLFVGLGWRDLATGFMAGMKEAR